MLTFLRFSRRSHVDPEDPEPVERAQDQKDAADEFGRRRRYRFGRPEGKVHLRDHVLRPESCVPI